MKAKISRGTGFRGALDYVLDAGTKATGKRAERVGGNIAGDTPAAMAREFAVTRRLRPDIARPVWHCSLSLPAGEKLSAERWNEVADDFMYLMGFDATKHMYVVVRHSDTDHDHVHIVASRIALDGAVWLGQWEARTAIEATQGLEKIHGLTLTPGLGEARAERKKLSGAEIHMSARTAEEPPRRQLQKIIDAVLEGPLTAVEFADRLLRPGWKSGRIWPARAE